MESSRAKVVQVQGTNAQGPGGRKGGGEADINQPEADTYGAGGHVAS